MSEAPGQQPGGLWAAIAIGIAAVLAPSPLGTAISLPSHPREAENHGSGWDHQVVSGWKRGFFLCSFLLAWVHYRTAVEPLPAPVQLVTGEGRTTCTSSVDLSIELVGGPHARKSSSE